MAPPIKTRPSFPLSQSLPSGSFHKPLILLRQRADNENHNDRKLTKPITWTTASSSSVKLWAMPCGATQDGRVTAERSDKMWSTGEGNGKPLQYSCLENPMNSMNKAMRVGRRNWEEGFLNFVSVETGWSNDGEWIKDSGNWFCPLSQYSKNING